MVSRLVLGCGAVGHTIVGVVATWGGDLRAVVADESRVDALNEASVRTTVGDPTDPTTYPESTDVVLVLGDDAETNREAALRAREAFPDALLLACTGTDADDAIRADVAAVADRVVDGRREVSDHLLGSIAGAQANRTGKLLRVLRELDGPLAVVMHDNPDPDAIASALALSLIARSVGIDADPCYFGEISHQENRALVNVLDLTLRNLESASDLEEYAGIALVDHSRPGVNDRLDEDTSIDVVVDHHPPRAPVEGRYVDLRSDVGATSTLLTEYLDRLGIDPDRVVATALLYGIWVDTRNFTREAVEADFEAAAFLLPFVDASVLDKVEAPSMSPDVLETLARAIRNRDVRGEVLTTGVGEIRDRDALAQAADQLLDMEGIDIVVVYGFVDGTIYVSGRARGTEVDLGEVFRDALAAIGSAGGHADMAGAQIPLGILGEVSEDATVSLSSIVDEVIAERIFEVLENPPSAPQRDDDPSGLAFEFSLERE